MPRIFFSRDFSQILLGRLDVSGPEKELRGTVFSLAEEEDYHYLKNVMRCRRGDRFVGLPWRRPPEFWRNPALTDASSPDSELVFRIEGFEKGVVEASLLRFRQVQTESPLPLIVAPSLLKGDNFELVLQKATELGAWGFLPLTMRHTVARLKPDREEKKRRRWERIIKEAAEQSGRTRVPHLFANASLDDVCQYFEEENSDLNARVQEVLGAVKRRGRWLAGHPGEDPFPEAMGEEKDNGRRSPVLLVAGPEGGFSDAEVRRMRRMGVRLFSFGPRTLRSETAAICLTAVVQAKMGDGGEHR